MRRVAMGLGIAALVCAILGAAVVTFRFPLTAAGLSFGLARAGFPDATFTLERVDRQAIVVARIESGTALRVERCEIDLDWSRLPRLPVARVRAAGARIDLARSSPTGEAAPSESEASPAELPLGLVPALELEDAAATIESPVGPIAVEIDSRVDPEDGALGMRLEGKARGKAVDAAFGGEARLDAGGAVSITVRLTALDVRDDKLVIAGGAATATVAGETAGITLRNAEGTLEASARDVAFAGTRIGAVETKIPMKVARGAGQWIARIAGADVRLQDKRLHASAIDGEASARSAKLAIGSLEDTATSRRFEPLEIEARVSRGEPELDFSADVRAARGRATVHAEGRYDASRGVALVDIGVPKATLAKGKLRLVDLSPLLAGVGETGGTVEGEAHLRWSTAKGLSGDGRVKLADVSASSPRIRVGGLTGEVKLAGLFPPVTAGTQTLRAAEMHPGVLFSDATLRFALEPAKASHGSRLEIESFETAFAGGKIYVDHTVLGPFAPENSIVFHLEDLDAVELFKIARVEGVTGSGRLSGTIPVVVRNGSVAIPKGELVAKGGVLQIRSEQVSKLLSGGGPSVELLLDALRDFHYDELSVTIAKEFEGEASIAMHLAGQNPEVENGQPFRVNLNLTGNLDRLVASLLEVARLSDRAVRATVDAVKPEGH